MAGSRWRGRWARRENIRRRRAYEDTLASWYVWGIRLLRLRAAAEDVPVGPARDLPVRLADGEVVVAVQPRAELVRVEAHRHADLPATELAVVPVRGRKRARRLPHGLRPVDAGAAVITDRRVVLLGRKADHEWTFPLLGGLAHYPTAPITLLHTVDGRRPAGIRVPLDDAAHFRLRLTLAYADAVGQRRLVLARLDEAVAATRRSRPPLPPVATADQAPAMARLARPAAVAAAVAVLALPAYAMMAGPFAPDRPPRTVGGAPPGTPPVPTALPEAPSSPGSDPGTASASPATTTPGRPAGATIAPARAVGVPSSGSAGAVAARRSTPRPRPVPQVTPPPAARPGPVRPSPVRPTVSPVRPTVSPSRPPVLPQDQCGAPVNPFGYTYCGGALIHAPDVGVCRWFVCVDDFWMGAGYLAKCEDGSIGMVGGPAGRCPERAGRKEPVYVYRPASK